MPFWLVYIENRFWNTICFYLCKHHHYLGNFEGSKREPAFAASGTPALWEVSTYDIYMCINIYIYICIHIYIYKCMYVYIYIYI
jgi:hypothetical protein